MLIPSVPEAMFASNEKCQTEWSVTVKEKNDTVEEKNVLALGDSAMCENQVEFFYIMSVEAL